MKHERDEVDLVAAVQLLEVDYAEVTAQHERLEVLGVHRRRHCRG